MRLRLLLITLFLLIASHMVFGQGDGIPDNCEFVAEVTHEFVRYEPQNRRLMLVDWRTGDDIRVVAGDIDSTIIMGWSASCRYIAGAVGTADSMDTVVWDVQTGERMGVVPDAHNQSHHITWGAHDYLVVETRDGAVLWHVPTHRQTILTTHYDPVTVRNFSRLRWDAANNQLIANLSGSGRVVYDLNTGEEVPQVAHQTDTYPGDAEREVLIGSAIYDCSGGYRYGYRTWYRSDQNAPRELLLEANVNVRQIYVTLYNSSGSREVLVVLENDVSISSFQRRGWSADCRYVAASLGQVGRNASDTYVWDVTTGERVGILPDAVDIVHPLYWHPSQPVLLAETRNGAVFWHLPGNTQSLLDTGTETALAGRRAIHNFTTHAWSNDYLFLTPVSDPQSIQVYQMATGELVTSTIISHDVEKITPSPFGNYVLICCDDAEQYLLWKRNTGETVVLQSTSQYSRFHINPSEQYLATFGQGGVFVWDLATTDGRPFANYSDAVIGYNAVFVDDVVLRSRESQVNIINGDYIVFRSDTQTPVQTNAVDGQSGYSPYNYSRNCTGITYYNGQVPENPNLYEYSVWNGSTQLFSIQLGKRYYSPGTSPDCRWIYGEVPFYVPNAAYDDAAIDDSYRERNSDYLTFWDATTGEVVHQFYHPYRYGTYTSVIWSPDSQYALVRTTEGTYIYNPADDRAILLTFNEDDDYLNVYANTYWDFERGFVLVTGRKVYAFDIGSGALLYEFTSHPAGYGGGYRLVDNQYIVVGVAGNIGIWNLDTIEVRFISTRIGETWYRTRYTRWHMSPSGRFAISVRRDGTIAVWDLDNLAPEINERLPYFVRLHDLGYGFESIRFVDDTTVEIVQDGESYQLSVLPPEGG